MKASRLSPTLETKMLKNIFTIAIFLSLSACSLTGNSNNSSDTALLLPDMQQSRYLKSGTIILSRQLPTAADSLLAKASDKSEPMAPIIGYVPPAKSFLPAVNEAWLEIDRANRTLTVFRGKEKLKVISANGVVGLPGGNYMISAKQLAPVWNAPDQYFAKRNLPLPTNAEDRRLRGALGSQAIFAENLSIHSAPFWTEDVGGLRVASNDMQGIYSLLSVGSAVLVK